MSLLLRFIAHSVSKGLLSSGVVVIVTVAVSLLPGCLTGSYSSSLVLIVEYVFNALNVFFKSLIIR